MNRFPEGVEDPKTAKKRSNTTAYIYVAINTLIYSLKIALYSRRWDNTKYYHFHPPLAIIIGLKTKDIIAPQSWPELMIANLKN
jgi:hypothetical protein